MSGSCEKEDHANAIRIHLARWFRCHRLLIGSGTAVLGLALLALLVGQLLSYDRQRIARWQAEQQQYVTDMIVAQRAWDANYVGRVMELLKGQRPKESGGKDLRGWEWYRLERLCHNELRTLQGHKWAVSSVVFSQMGVKS